MSDRRELLEEVLELRSREVALTPALEGDTPAGSWVWELGLSRWALTAPFRLPERRQRALECAAIALAWLEACDSEIRARSASPGS